MHGHLTPEAKLRRTIKNARNFKKRGQDTREPGAIKKITSRLFRLGNKQRRGS